MLDKKRIYSYNKSGNDAFGNCTIASGTTDQALAKANSIRYRGYYYDTDLGMYYLQSRYYDPNTCRFISPDALSYLGANGDLTSYNLYAYCSNNPVNFVDPSGHAIETIWDAISLGFSIVDVVANPCDIWAWVGLAGDLVDLIPFVTGVGEAADLLRIAMIGSNVIDAVDNVHDTANIVDSAIDTYKNLKKVNKGNGLEVHHIVEKRFAKELNGINTNDMLSIALTHDEHVVFTRQWRKAIPYKTSYSIDDIWNAAQDIYANYPALLEAARKTLGR